MVSHDFMGNTVIASLEHNEQTLAGLVPATFIASPEGVHLLANNPGILSQIYDGHVIQGNNTLGGMESKVYTIFLITNDGKKEFALKYTFPIDEGRDKFFTSGIVAMRLMQLAEEQRPIPHIHYTVPIFATHDITVAPFTFHGISTNKLIRYLDNPNYSFMVSNLLNDVFRQEERDMIREMGHWESEAQQKYQSSFVDHVHATFEEQRKILVDWVSQQFRYYRELAQHRYSTIDTSLMQSVVNIEEVYALSRKYYADPSFNSYDPTFVSTLLNSLSLIELGIGRVLDL